MAQIKRVCVYCASSNKCNKFYLEAAYKLGIQLAQNGIVTYYGGGAVGLMGSLADGAISAGGEVVGIIPDFMQQLEWGHKGITKLHIVNTMHERKSMIVSESDAFVALPGGCGTLEELLEVITWKRLGLHSKPIIITNLKGFFNPCIEMLNQCVREHFMHEKHLQMWTVVDSVDEIIPALSNGEAWYKDARDFAVLK